MAARAVLIELFLFLFCFAGYLAEDSQRLLRFEYKFSFKGPHLITKNREVPFWTVGGSAIPSDEQVRITPSLTNKRGYMWSKNEYTAWWFEIEAELKISGHGRVGADGMAIWFRDVAGSEGDVFGSNNQWKGLGILLDSFDNDGQNNNPFISIMVNDGSQIYDHHSDGSHQTQGGCLRNFRNRPHPVKLKVRYFESVLTVWFHQGISEKTEYELCTRVEDVQLPKKGVFGISAATGGLADDHDVLSFITHSITTTTVDKDVKLKMTEDEMKKISEQYGQMAEKFQKEKDDYAKAHPKKETPEEQYQTSYERDLRMIYEGQNALHHIVNNLHKKTGELANQVNELQKVITTQDNSKPGDGISRQELNSIINVQSQLSNGMQEVKNMVQNLGSDREKRDTGDGGNLASEINSLKGSMEIMIENVNHLVTKQQFAAKDREPDKPCPTPEKTNCIGPGYFILLIAVQMVLLVSYFSYKSHKEAAAKKFF